MLDRLIKRFEKAGKIRKQKAGIVQMEALLKEAILDLEEAKRIVNIAERATYEVKHFSLDKKYQLIP